MTTLPVDIAHTQYMARKAELSALAPEANEATTRLRVIDTILVEVLDWQKADIEPEKYCRAEGYADYVCCVEGRKLLVVEAKRSGTTFALPSDMLESRPYSFGFIASESKDAADALQQAIGYAATLGAHYAAVTNGKQWLLTLTYVEGKELDERLAFVFESLDAIADRFRTFWQCFSKAQLAKHSIDVSLLDILLKPAPAKASARIAAYPIVASRNVFQNELAYVLDYVWQVMSQDDGSADFVQNCYVSPDSHKDSIALVRELLSKRTNEDAVLTQHEIVSIDKLPQQLAHLPTARPFVILGQVGRGKSSFLGYLRHMAASDLLGKFIQIDLNFIDRPDAPADLATYVYDEIERQLLSSHSIDIRDNRFVRGVLNSDLQRLQKTPRGSFAAGDTARYAEFELEEIERILSNRHTYLTRVFHHLKKGRGCSIAIFMDNLDRRDADLQEQAFLRASAMARDWASMLFICLRPETFYKSRESGVLDTIAPTTFTVSHPDLALVLKRRFAYAKSIADGQRLMSATGNGHNPHIGLHLPRVSAILGSCEFAARRKHGIIPLLDAVSNGNIRRMLDLARAILCSGHLDTKKILDSITKDGHYAIPDFEGIKALLYGEYKQYFPVESPFVNLFDILHSQRSEHFLTICALHFLSRPATETLGRGFTSRADVTAYLSGLGFSLQAIDACIQTAEAKQLVCTSLVPEDGIHDRQRYRLTSLGLFHLHHLPRIFQYIDAMTLDTPVLDADVRAVIGDTYAINERVERTKAFLRYLDKSVSSVLDPVIVEFWHEHSSAAWDGIAEVERRIEVKT